MKGATVKPPTLYLMVGIPASGKTTWASRYFRPPVQVIHLDRIRHSVYGLIPQTLDNGLESRVWSLAYDQMGQALRNGVSVVLDSMALTRAWRERHVREADRRAGSRVRRVVIFLDTPISIALSRNARRNKVVLAQTVRAMAGHLEPPTGEEGFDELVYVTPKGPAAGRFRTEPPRPISRRRESGSGTSPPLG